jgi:hypothetical protein
VLKEHQEVNFQGGKIQMRVKQIRVLLLAFACCSLLAVAQDSSLTNVTGGGTKGKIPLWTGAHSIGNSIMKQGGGGVTVSGTVSASTTGVNAGVSGTTKASSGMVNGVSGTNASASPGLALGAGVYGLESTTGGSITGTIFNFAGGGTWGDGGADSNYGLIGTTDNRAAGIFWNGGAGVDPGFYTNFSFNFATGGVGFPWAAQNGDGAGCNIDPVGDLTCTGAKNAAVPVDGGKHYVAMAAIESPKNWFEDFGSARLSGGVAVVRLDSRFTQTVNAKMEYHVFLTPNGDCKGLYVHQKDANSFEVRELGGGNSSIKFDYRITALRKNYESIRFANHPEFPLGHSRDGRVFAKK